MISTGLREKLREIEAPVILNKRQHLLGLPGYWFIVPIELGFLAYGVLGGSLVRAILVGVVAYGLLWTLLHDKPPNFTLYWTQYLLYPKRFGHRARGLPTPPFGETQALRPDFRLSWSRHESRGAGASAHQGGHMTPDGRPSGGNDCAADSLDYPRGIAVSQAQRSDGPAVDAKENR